MHKRDYSNKKARWFSQWSRKAYAIFLSISKVVHIGKLSVDISKQALLKTSGASILSLATVSGEVSMLDLAESPANDDGESLFSALNNAIIGLILPQNQKSLVAQAGYNDTASAQKNITHNIITRLESLTKLSDSGLFSFV